MDLPNYIRAELQVAQPMNVDHGTGPADRDFRPWMYSVDVP